MIRTLLILVVTAYSFCLSAKDYLITGFGAKGDGKTLNTKIFQTAIDQIAEKGGGRLIVPKGIFLSGSIILKSNIELHIEKGGVIMGSTNPEDYKGINRWKGLILADNEKNIALTGKGIINGQGTELALNIDKLFYIGQLDSSRYDLKNKRPIAPERPQIIEFVKCRNIVVKDVTIKDGASWIQSYFESRDIVIDNVKVYSDAYWNNDGIDIIDCKQVKITNCDINSTDDGICLKSYNYPRDPNVFCDSIYVGNCKVRSSASAIKLGTSSYSGFKNITIENIEVYDTYRSAIALESWEAGSLENVLIQNITAKNTGNAFFIRLGKRYKDERVGVLKNVTIRNLKCTVPEDRPDKAYIFKGPALPFFHNTFPSSIVGLPGHRVEQVKLENIEISYPGDGNAGYANLPLERIKDVPEMPNIYPEFSMFGELPAWGLYIRHADEIEIKGLTLKVRKKDYRPAIVLDDVLHYSSENEKIIGEGNQTYQVK